MPCARRAGIAFLLAALALAPAAARTGSPDASAAVPVDPNALLRASIAAPAAVSYVGQTETIGFSSMRAAATIVKVEHLAPGSTRRWYVAPEALYGDYAIARGGTTYEFDTKRRTMTVTRVAAPLDSVATADDVDRVLQNYRALPDGSDVVADRKTISLVLVNRYTGERALRVWLDRETHLVLKKEAYHANGAVASQTRFEELRYTSDIPAGLFSTDLPSGYARVDGPAAGAASADVAHAIAGAGFKPYEPRSLPQGFELVGADDARIGGVPTLHLVYSDGLRSVSLFENAKDAAADYGAVKPRTVSFEGHDASYVEDGSTTLLTWREHGLHFALVGDLMRSELVAIGESVVP